MVDVMNQRCDHSDGCNKRASYRLPNTRGATRCFRHKGPGMVSASHNYIYNSKHLHLFASIAITTVLIYT